MAPSFSAAQANFKILEYRLPQQLPWLPDPYLPKDGYLELRPDGSTSYT